MPDAIRILLLDDHALVREAIARLLAAQPDFEVVGEVATVDEGIDILKKMPVDIVLLDINLGTHQGGAFPNLARAQGYRGRILVVTAGVSKVEADRLMYKGCSGIFLKHERPPLLIDKIRTIMAGDGLAEGSTASPTHPIQPEQKEDRPSFTRRELEVLRRVCSGHLNKEIAFELGISEALVKAFVQQLFSKTGVRNRAQLVRVAVEKYFMELEEDPETV